MKDELIRLLAGRRGHFAMESGYHGEWWAGEPLEEISDAGLSTCEASNNAANFA